MWEVAALDDELRDWRQAREKHASEQYEKAEALAAKKELIRNARGGGCRRCFARLDGRKFLCGDCSRAEYWRRRLTVKQLGERKTACGVDKFEGFCRKCGVIEEWPRLCGAKQVCHPCAARYYAKQQEKLERALDARLGEHYERWTRGGFRYGQRPAVALITLGVSNTGDVVADRALLSKAWNRWRTWYSKKYGEKLCYSWVAECTDGRPRAGEDEKRGNPHLHVACLLPFRDYRELIAAWSNATEGQGRRIDVQSKFRTAKNAAKYIAKYASKGTKTLYTPSLAASWVKAQHCRRSISTSYKFWLPDALCAHAKKALRDARESWLHQGQCNISASSKAARAGSATASRGPPVDASPT